MNQACTANELMTKVISHPNILSYIQELIIVNDHLTFENTNINNKIISIAMDYGFFLPEQDDPEFLLQVTT